MVSRTRAFQTLSSTVINSGIKTVINLNYADIAGENCEKEAGRGDGGNFGSHANI